MPPKSCMVKIAPLSTLAPLGTFDVRIIVDTGGSFPASHVPNKAEASDDMTILLIHYEPKTIRQL